MNARFSFGRRPAATIFGAIAIAISSTTALAQAPAPAAPAAFTLPRCEKVGQTVSVRLMTGVQLNGTTPVAFGATDPRWTVTPGGPTYVTNRAGPWRNPTNPVRWIQPVPGANPAQANAGVYRYRLQFNTPADPYLYTSFAISGIVAADNAIDAIRLDNQSLTPPTCAMANTVGCMAGINESLATPNPGQVNPASPHVLEIHVNNRESVTGLYVDLTVKAVCSKCTMPRPPFQQKSSLRRSPSRQSLLQSTPPVPSC